jgi:putative membrane protein
MIKTFGFFLVSYLCLFGLDNLVDTITVSNNWSTLGLFLLILTVLNWTLLPILKFFSFPITLLTFGLFNCILNMVIIWIAMQFNNGAISNTGPGITYLVNLFFISLTLTVANTIINTLM